MKCKNCKSEDLFRIGKAKFACNDCDTVFKVEPDGKAGIDNKFMAMVEDMHKKLFPEKYEEKPDDKKGGKKDDKKKKGWDE